MAGWPGDERREWLKVVAGTAAAVVIAVIGATLWRPGAEAAIEDDGGARVVWSTSRCDEVRSALRAGRTPAQVARVVRRTEVTALDVQCFTHPSMPLVVQIAALEAIAARDPAYRPALAARLRERR